MPLTLIVIIIGQNEEDKAEHLPPSWPCSLSLFGSISALMAPMANSNCDCSFWSSSPAIGRANWPSMSYTPINVRIVGISVFAFDIPHFSLSTADGAMADVYIFTVSQTLLHVEQPIEICSSEDDTSNHCQLIKFRSDKRSDIYSNIFKVIKIRC